MCRRKKKVVKKIYKTTDGIFNGRDDIRKPRPVAVVDQRDDGALAVLKIHTKKGKDGKMYIDKLVLTPSKHSSLTEDSILEKRVYIGITKKGEGNVHLPIYSRDLEDMNDELTQKEYRQVMKGLKGDTRDKKNKHKKKMKKWHKHFKK